MKKVRVYNKLKDRSEILVLDDNFFEWLKKGKKVIQFNNYDYPMIEAFGKLRPLHCVCYYLNYKIWSEQWVTAIHHRSGEKLNCTIENLELVDWQNHGIVHAIQKGYYAKPRPDTLEVA